VILCDNISALHIVANLIFHVRTCNIEIDYDFAQEHVARGALRTRYVPSDEQLADIFTKGLRISSVICVPSSNSSKHHFT